ncbi:MAG: hypothetical protein AUJ96_10795 [Armatimonadetes bacterium CG2_30_66_41]|nr:MAG: hypothetical protein AUJ96_10795 [Armatimonadetes bacterium CG2_30_66_41]
MPFACLGLLTACSAASPLAAATPAHPRLFVTAADLPRLRAMAADSQTNALGYVPAEAWKAILAQADQFASAPPYHYAVDMPGKTLGVHGPSEPDLFQVADAAYLPCLFARLGEDRE